ncbi:hypothetical protein EO98_17170 [Methanosarcina sp. 2.H.T.1A.6]|nr:hypothetical protein EO97_02145 [Methanosarcina sp. 2.H.T.1A.15]KKG15082.1 hypothetical protein EO94_04225 [Methanosarcina sp. 2.H.T.1A.3]KKG20781.1 hypothetical protein EO96_18215 [Methanosarcina sp. 2.H.T.1A.8]KKG22098.1 hypothetical protein EO98_17170 [Methanosarcina sp. 2.H.T.1A.6]
MESLYPFITKGGIAASNHEIIETDFDIPPSEFLKFAEFDLIAEYEHHLVNSLSNTKRAIDSQLDSLLIGFGLSEKSKRWRFPKKIEFLNSIGIISPRILNKINRKRNLLEHEYKNPNKEEVEDALDIATLFVSYTNKYLSPALVECELFDDKELWNEPPSVLRDEKLQYVTITLDWRNSKLIFDFPSSTRNTNGKYDHIVEELTANDTDYDEYLKFYLSLYDIIHR